MRGTTNGVRLLVLWAVFAIVMAGPMVLGNHLPARKAFSVSYPLTLSAVSGLYWALLADVLSRVIARVPFSRARWGWAAALHVVGLVASVVGHALLFRAVTAGFGLSDDPRLRAGADEFAIGIGIQLYVVIVAVISIYQFQARAQRAERAQVEAERLASGARALALRSQLNAHFLFNSLNTVAMGIRRADMDEALSIVLGLSGLLRTVLRENSAELVSLKDEIEFVARYLGIEQVRFRDRLKVEWAIAPDVQHAAVPALILQPIVENALRHGIGRQSDAGLLRIQADRANGTLTISVDDDGPGFHPSWTDGGGLSNVRARLMIHFAAAAKIDVVNRERGASVRLSLPFSEASANA